MVKLTKCLKNLSSISIVFVTCILLLNFFACREENLEGLSASPDELRAVDLHGSKDFEIQWRNLERNTGTSSSLRFYNLNVPVRYEGVAVIDALDWIEAHNWDLQSTTATLMKKIVEQHPAIFKSLERGVALDAPFWPTGLDSNTPVPSYDGLRTISLLTLFRARISAENNLTSSVQDALTVMSLGRHLLHHNAVSPTLGAGDSTRRSAIGFLSWLMEHETRPLPNAGDLARQLDHERTRITPLIDLCLQDISNWRDFVMTEYDAVRQEATINPRLMAQVRDIYSKSMGRTGLLPTDTQILNLLSTASLQQRFDEISSLTLAFGHLSPAERIRRRDLAERLTTVPALGVAPLSIWSQKQFVVTDIMPLIFFRSDKTEGALRRLISALAMQHASLNGDLPEVNAALRHLGISEDVAIDPFSEIAFRCHVTKLDRAVMEFGGLDILHNLGLDPQTLSFPIHRTRH